MDNEKTNIYTADIRVPFPSEREAEIACNSLKVDGEPKSRGISRHFTVVGNALIVKFSATEARQLRTSCTSFFDNVTLVLRTLQQFGPPLP